MSNAQFRKLLFLAGGYLLGQVLVRVGVAVYIWVAQ